MVVSSEEKKQCAVCGYVGKDVHEYPTYDHELKRDSTELQCDSIEACLDRRLKDGNSSSR